MCNFQYPCSFAVYYVLLCALFISASLNKQRLLCSLNTAEECCDIIGNYGHLFQAYGMNQEWELRLSAIFKQNSKPSICQNENDAHTINWHSWSFPLASQKARCDAGKDFGSQAYSPIEPLPLSAQETSAKPPWHTHPSFSNWRSENLQCLPLMAAMTNELFFIDSLLNKQCQW